MRTRILGQVLFAAIAAAACGAMSAAAQYPPQPGIPEPPEYVPREDPDVEQAQFTRPVVPAAATRPAASRPIADPPPPLVRIQVRIPSDAAPGDDLKYLIAVQNVSRADAHQVTVRNPLPEGVQHVIKADPPPDSKASSEKQIVWSFGTLKPGEKRLIELVLKPKLDAKEVKNLAYVRFEHGEAVTTRIARPTLKLTKSAPKESVRGDSFTVRVMVENTGRVPVDKVRVVENADRTADLQAVTAGAARTKSDENQWEWQIGTLMPGQRKVIEYRMTPRMSADSFSTTNVSGDKGVMEKAEARIKVHTPGLSLKLTGPTGVVNAGEAARYEVTVRNVGTFPSRNVKVSTAIPSDCKPTMKTEGGQVARGAITWTVPRLDPGEARSFRFGLKAPTTGRRVISVHAADARKVTATDELATLFQGVASLSWTTELEPAALAVGRQGTFTVRVRNSGGEDARNVRLELELPPEVTLKQSTPDIRAAGNRLAYGPSSIGAYGEAVYTITYEAKQSAQAWFRVKLTAEALGDRPLTTEKAISITGGR